MSPEEFDRQHGAAATDIAAIRKFAKAGNLAVVRESVSRRSVILAGTVEDFNQAFGVSLKTYVFPSGTYRGRTGYILIPADLADVVQGVFGLDNRPVARRRHRASRPAAAASDGARAFYPNEVAKLYSFPIDADGTGQTIGIIELGGGYRPEDLQNYFDRLGLPVPIVIPVSVDGASNSPTTADSDDGEVVLDIQVAGACAPGARIVVYFSKNDRASNGFLDALTKAVHDNENNPSIVSISWGGSEDPNAAGFQAQFDQVLQEAALLGVTVCVASGDDGAADTGPKAWDGKPHVDFPASSPFALACGGTRLLSGGSSIASESVWNQHEAEIDQFTGPDGSFGSSGGGVSRTFALPNYQNSANVPTAADPAGFKGRGVPDVAADGDPASGYNILVDGIATPIGGTSAVAPLWAALIARINQKLGGRVGFLNPQIYSFPANSGGFNDITRGDNRCTFQTFNSVGFDARPGWDACTGLGSPNGAKLSGLLKAAPAVAEYKIAAARKARRGVRKAVAAKAATAASRRVSS
jgi:kumamolisin